jgi:hypothetical protein
MKALADIRAEWLRELLSTAPADRARAEAAVRRLYTAAGFAEPRHVIWFDSPFRASWVVALLVAPHHHIWAQKMSSPSLSKGDRAQLDRARETLGSALGITDPGAAVAAASGGPLGMHLQFPPVPSRMLGTKFFEARYSLSRDVSGMFTVHGDDDELNRAETNYWGSNRGALRSALHCPTTDQLIGNSFAEDYSFSTMADDEHRVGDREPPPTMQAAWEVARSSGMWWPFEHVAIMSDRPAEVHVNDRYLLHRENGPAVVYRDDWNVFAWNGKAVPRQWIMEPKAVPPREYKGFDPTFAKHVKSKAAPVAKAKKRGKTGSILSVALPADHPARLEQLRAHAGGGLPRFDRYRGGAHREVWQELVALGAAVREEPHAADALAVAYETMRRAQANVRTLVQRLEAMHYVFSTTKQEKRDTKARPHVPPAADIQKRVLRFEKEFGTLPLSLRAFYEVVGEVNFIGTHPTLDPSDNDVAPDPLLVFGLDEGIVEYDEGDDEDEEEGRPAAVTIAPDDLHKANTSGGDPYEMAIPDLRADGELLNERHQLFFVDYLRLCFRFGGFPGYDGAAKVPAEIATLSAGLIEL